MLVQAGRKAAGEQPPVRLLGLDPGLRHTGWGIVDVAGNRLTHVADGAVHSDDGCPLAERLCQLHDALSAVLERYRPDEAAVEETFVNTNAASTLKLGQARAVALLVPARAGLAVAEYANNMVKKAVVGQGRADKAQVQAMVRLLLPGCAIATPDAADALAVAICHAHHRRSMLAWSVAAAAGNGGRLLTRRPAGSEAAPAAPAGAEEARAGGALRRDTADVEKRLWQRLRNARLGAKFLRREAILGVTVDFVAHEHRLVIELEAGAPAEPGGPDPRRSRLLEQAGFRVLRFRNGELDEDLDGVLATIRARLDETTVVRRGPPGRESLS